MVPVETTIVSAVAVLATVAMALRALGVFGGGRSALVMRNGSAVAIYIIIAVALTLAAAQAASAQPAARPAEPVPARLTLEQALARADTESHRLAELRAREGAAGAVLAARRAADLPVVSAQAGYQRTNHVEEFGLLQPDGSIGILYPDVPDNWRTRLDLQWPIYTGGRTQALERAALAER